MHPTSVWFNLSLYDFLECLQNSTKFEILLQVTVIKLKNMLAIFWQIVSSFWTSEVQFGQLSVIFNHCQDVRWNLGPTHLLTLFLHPSHICAQFHVLVVLLRQLQFHQLQAGL